VVVADVGVAEVVAAVAAAIEAVAVVVDSAAETKVAKMANKVGAPFTRGLALRRAEHKLASNAEPVPVLLPARKARARAPVLEVAAVWHS
jgi:hypothetical protein